ncbi:MAG: hypothetical protein ABH873_07815 [Candidatus Firestonebacteria bacterium]
MKKIIAITCILILPSLLFALNCDICKRPSFNLIQAGDKRLCPTCYGNIPRCAGCGELVIKQGWKSKSDDRIYCNKCYNSKDVCDVCGVPLPSGQGVVFEKNRKICEKCKVTSIIDSKEAEEIYKSIIEFASKTYNMRLKHNTPIKMISRDEMKKLAEGKIKNADRLFGLFKKDKKGNFAIYFLFGTPRYITRATIAHEFAHAWQEENCVKGQSEIVSEGFAEWFAAKILYNFNEREGAKIVETRQDVYGDGFRYFANLEEKSNADSVINHAKYIKDICKKK